MSKNGSSVNPGRGRRRHEASNVSYRRAADVGDWLGFVDATVIAAAERLKMSTIATTPSFRHRLAGARRTVHACAVTGRRSVRGPRSPEISCAGVRDAQRSHSSGRCASRRFLLFAPPAPSGSTARSMNRIGPARLWHAASCRRIPLFGWRAAGCERLDERVLGRFYFPPPAGVSRKARTRPSTTPVPTI